MLAATPPPEQTCEPDWRAEHLAMLRELAELNMRLARAVVTQAEAAARPDEPEAQPGPRTTDPSLALSRLGRAVRLTLAMEARVRGEAQDAADADARRPDPLASERTQRALSIESARAFVTETLEAAVELAPRDILEARDTPDRESLLEDVFDRIDGLCDDLFFEVPEGILIERLCAEFGLDPDPDTMADRHEDRLWRGWNLPPPEPAPPEPVDPEQTLELSS